MNFTKLWKTALPVSVVTLAVAGMLITIPLGRADNANGNDEEAKIKQGLAITPVHLTYQEKDKKLVGLGSYLVNAVASCNDCHSAGPETQYTINPYFNQHPTTVNPDTFLGGGRDFGQFPAPGPFPNIISRNLTPDKSGLPAGGMSLDDFRTVLRTGKDFDHLHQTCSGPPNGTCLPAPFDGDLLQIMPWPVLQNLTDHDIDAIYEYLKSIPCIAGPAAPSILHNDCK